MMEMIKDGATIKDVIEECLCDWGGKIENVLCDAGMQDALILYGDGTGGIDVEAYAKALQEPDARGDCFSPEAARELAEAVDANLHLIYGDTRAKKPLGTIYAT